MRHILDEWRQKRARQSQLSEKQGYLRIRVATCYHRGNVGQTLPYLSYRAQTTELQRSWTVSSPAAKGTLITAFPQKECRGIPSLRYYYMARFLGRLIILLLSFYWQELQSVCPFEYEITRPDQSARLNDIPLVKFQKRVRRRIEGNAQAIPFIIHQTHENDTVPIDLVMSIESILQQNPEYEYRYYNSTERREFIKQHMGDTVLSCYDKLNPKAYKADLFRYSTVYTNGGCYVDSGVIFINGLRTVIGKDDVYVSSPDQISLNAAFFCATKQHPLLSIAIEILVQRVADNFYGVDPIDMTGPRLLQKAFQQYYLPLKFYIKQGLYPQHVKLLVKHTPSLECLTNFIIDFDQRILFHHRYPRMIEDFSRTSIMVHYTQYFRNRTVYNESVSVSAEGFSIKSIPAFTQPTLELAPITT